MKWIKKNRISNLFFLYNYSVLKNDIIYIKGGLKKMVNLKIFREKKGYSQRYVARYMGISQAQYWHLEKELSIINANQIFKLCNLYECTLNDLIKFKQSNTHKSNYNNLDEGQRTLYNLALSYFTMLEYSKDNLGHILSFDYGYYPLLFNLRHSFELLLKSNILEIIKNNPNDHIEFLNELSKSHDINFLLKKYINLNSNIKKDYYYDFIMVTIKNINDFDKNSMILRYGTDKDFKPNNKPKKALTEIKWSDKRGLKILNANLLESKYYNYKIDDENILKIINDGYKTFNILKMYNQYCKEKEILKKEGINFNE
jgi:transcriptional regulator with XRE-family HTH domain